MSADIEQIQNLVQSIQESEKSPEIIEWMKEISEREYELVNLFISAFMQQFDDIAVANSILMALKKLNDFVPEQVLPQMRENVDFPIIISKYIVTTSVENLIGEAFLLLVDIFSVSSFKSVANEAFVKRLFDLFQVINDEETFNAIVKIFINISFEQPKPNDDIVIKVATTHCDQRLFSETLLQLLNKNDAEMIKKTLIFIKKVYKVQPNFFYSHDFKVLIDVCLRESRNTQSDELRDMFIDVLVTLTATQEYQKERHRKESIYRLVDEIQYATVPQSSKALSLELKQSLEKQKNK